MTNFSDRPVGYCKPPRQHTWQPGQSGNPRGRPRKRRTVADDLRDALMASVTVVENGRRIRITCQALIIRRIVRDAANGNAAAQRQLLAWIGRYQSSDDTTLDPGDLSSADRAILDEYLQGNASGMGTPTMEADMPAGQIGDATDGAGA